MLRKIIFIVSCIFYFQGTIAKEARILDSLKGEKIELFNKKDLNGWYVFLKGRNINEDPKNVFVVKNKKMKISGEEWGYIATESEYENYHLILDYKWVGPTHGERKELARDGGLLLHGNGPDGGTRGTWMSSIECNIIEGGTGDFIVISDDSNNFAITSPIAKERHGKTPVYQKGGELFEVTGGRVNWYGRSAQWDGKIGFRGPNDIEKSVGKWNRLECVVWKDSIDIYLNGILVNQAIRVRPSKGKIALQSEGAEMMIKKLDIIPLSQHTRLYE